MEFRFDEGVRRVCEKGGECEEDVLFCFGV